MPDENDLRARVVGLEHTAQSSIHRLNALETWQRQREIDSARHDEKWVAMEARIDTRFNGLESANKSIQSTLSRIMWIVVGGILAAAVTFVVSGGLKAI
ncbi:hypothetical protein FHS76_002036 [Ochrobactrum daejeonense]|uniref:Uncharacterized protein n=1 Tax=Brucella daejeonensis TaxID=659015 RepID=A0A7W9AX62_9HYPH|nr:hypothetical protein [Brucella daejeonensis]MBB5702161.1 hypothetical protein [Brucella daejeonensis]NKB80000.1 hypothetical protein [Brucella daejeonensis]